MKQNMKGPSLLHFASTLRALQLSYPIRKVNMLESAAPV